MPRPAWFNLRQYAPDGAVLTYPYHAGDVMWVPDSADSQIRPTLRVHDASTAYSTWLQTAVPGYRAANGTPLNSLITEQELPAAMLPLPDSAYGPAIAPDRIANQSYTYFSVITPGVAVRQFVQGALDGGLPLDWNMDDPLNGQTGTGVNGLRPGDTLFLFGGAIIRNKEANLVDAAGYAAGGGD